MANSWEHCMSLVPTLGLPKMMTVVGRRTRPTPAALEEWSTVVKILKPFPANLVMIISTDWDTEVLARRFLTNGSVCVVPKVWR